MCDHLDWENVLRVGLPVLTMRRSGSLAEAAMASSAMIGDMVAGSSSVLAFLKERAAADDGSVLKGKPEEIAKFLGYRRGEIDTSDPWAMVDFLEGFMVPVFRLRDEAVTCELLVHDESGPYVRAVVDRAMRVGEAMNLLYLAWFRELSAPYQMRQPPDQEFLAKQWAGQLSPYDYTVFDIDPSGRCANRRSWAEAFPNEIRLVQGRLAELRCAMHGSSRVQFYLDALIGALGQKDIGLLERDWSEVDRRWIEIPRTDPFVPVHGFENYEHPYGVSPEFRLAWRVTGKEEAKLIKGYRDAALSLIDFRSEHLASSKDAARNKLDRLDVGVFFSVVEGGCCLAHRLAGQVVPNRQDILAEGGKVFIADRASGVSATRLYQEKAREHCTPETAAVILPFITGAAMEKHTLGHECMHPVGCSPEIDEALGVTRDLLEEAKASAGGFLIGLSVGDPDEVRKETAAVAVARIFRFMVRPILEDQSYAPYVRENLVVLRTMLDAGMLRLTESGVEVDFDQQALTAWIAEVDVFVTDLLLAYAAHDRDRLKAMREKYCGAFDRGANKDMKRIIAWVNRTDDPEEDLE